MLKYAWFHTPFSTWMWCDGKEDDLWRPRRQGDGWETRKAGCHVIGRRATGPTSELIVMIYCSKVCRPYIFLNRTRAADVTTVPLFWFSQYFPRSGPVRLILSRKSKFQNSSYLRNALNLNVSMGFTCLGVIGQENNSQTCQTPSNRPPLPKFGEGAGNS